MKKLRRNNDIVIVKPDKGNGVIVLDKISYIESLRALLSDESKFKKSLGDETIKRQGSLQRFLLALKKGGFFDETTYDNIYPHGSLPARLYGLPKIHKIVQEGEMPPSRPIVSSIGSCNYKLAKFLGNMLRPYICTDFSCSDTFSFVKEIQSKKFDDKCFMVSYDVQSLFTNIPLGETIDLAVDTLLESKPDLKISRDNFVKLFHFATSKTQFLFDGEYFEQKDGVAMGSPLAPILANLFLGNHEGTWLGDYDGHKPSYYKRYVDDIIAVFDNEEDAKIFLIYINSKHENIKFTMELENNKQLPFLDVFLDRSDGTLRTTTYRKQTFSGVMLNYYSFTPMSYKIGLVRCLIDRIFKINNTWMGFHLDLEKVFCFLKRNLYPERILNKVTEKYLNSKYVTNIDLACPEPRKLLISCYLI